MVWVALFPLALPPAASVGAEDPSDPLAATVAGLQERALAGNGAFDFVRDLTVQVGPRFAGSPGDAAAVAWAERRLRDLGFENVRREAVTVPHWVRGAAAGRILAPYPQPVVLTALGGSVATSAGGLEAEVVRVASLEALDRLERRQVEGKIVFFDGGMMPRRRDGSGYGVAVQPRSQGAVRAAPLGAVAVLIRSAGTSNDRIAHTGGMRYSDEVPRIPAAALSNPDADLLAAQLEEAEGRGLTVRFHLEISSRELPPVTSYNVIGEVLGRERPEEVVLLACHLDSWDLGTGAIDDGAGCAIVSEAARQVGSLPQRPRRTLRVVLFANEEFGLSGARAYAEAHAAEMDRHVAAMESDFGAGRVWAYRSRVATDRIAAADRIAGLLASLEIEYQTGNEARGGADLSPLARHRVPLFDLAHDGTDYFDVHHTVNDTLDRIDPENLAQAVAAYATAAYLAAELEEGFGRAPQPEERERR